MQSSKKRPEGMAGRVRLIGAGLIVAMAILIVRLWFLQIVHWWDYREMAENNRLHPQRLKAPRGLIYGPDESVVLADNRSSYDLVIIPAECGAENAEAVCQRLHDLLGIDAEALLKTMQETKRQPYRQVMVREDVSKTDLQRVEEFSYALPGVLTVAQPKRRYLQGKTAGQILGYLGEVTQGELDADEGYQGGDLVGRGGIEQVYEPEMRGRNGELVVNVYVSDRRPQLRTDAFGRPYVGVDSYGRELQAEFRRDPVSGGALFTTLDIDLQRHCESILEGEIGAIAVLNADTGEALALASVPSYDPSVFVTYGRDRERLDALTSKTKPMRNRCYQETYAPGSVFKVMLATAALEEGVIDEHTTFFCPGAFQLEGAGRKWHCWRRSGHGTVNVVDALAFSCDVFFYNVGLKLGIDRIKDWCNKLGLGVKSGIDLPAEVEGLIPSREWKEAQIRPKFPDAPWEWRWYPGNTVNLSIGQGEAATTPLQNAIMMAAIVNGGHHVRPFINKAIGPQVSDSFISEKTLKIVQAGMRKCVEKDPPAPTGTGNAAKVPGIIVLGKTGSAQMVGLEHHEEYANEEDIPYALRDHAWFVAGVLDREPRLAVCVLVEHGHHGSSAAAPLAKKVIEHFYGRQQPQEFTVAQEASKQ